MKFYYKDRSVRTSKTHYYTHAVMTKNDKLVACASSYDLAIKAITSNTGCERSNLDFYKQELKALEKGLLEFSIQNRYGIHKYKVKHTFEEIQKNIEYYEDYLKGLHIVELRAEM